ncbi:hypothetical protein [Rhodococcus marinonascens]|uniref:hypothetical protein n=1 Tax=Rhodococcus marinonascens TaxID=38311 RepID=UPI00093404AF|nr:hypothetical protein [Rhodococcus marinonascens]
MAPTTTTTRPTTTTATASPAAAYEPTDADSAAFVTAFRAAYPEMSNGRQDNPIANLLENTYQEISVGKEFSIIASNVGKRAEHQGVCPTPAQSQAIYDLADGYCPGASVPPPPARSDPGGTRASSRA